MSYMTGSISLWRNSSSSIFCTSLNRRYGSSSIVSIVPPGILYFHLTDFFMCIAPVAVMGMPICNTFIHSGLVPFHIHAVIPEERLHDLASNSPSLCFLFVLLFDTTPRSLSRRIPGQGSQSACLQRTGIIGIPPPPGSPEAALIAWSPAKGAVTGRKYHCQLSGAMAIQPCL